MMRTRNSEASQRFADRRERENQAPRLHAEVPTLESLNLELSERRAEATQADVTHVRRIVIAAAPAYFQSPCGDANCVDGGHEYTRPVMQALREHRAKFEGEHACLGNVGNNTCGRVLRFVGTAKFQEERTP